MQKLPDQMDSQVKVVLVTNSSLGQTNQYGSNKMKASQSPTDRRYNLSGVSRTAPGKKSIKNTSKLFGGVN